MARDEANEAGEAAGQHAGSPYPAPIAALLVPDRVAPLGPGTPNEAARSALKNLSTNTAFGEHRVRDSDMASCCLAGLWLYHDFVDEAHTIAQDIDTADGCQAGCGGNG